MKRILVLGAGQSSPYLIRYLLDGAEGNGWFVTVGDRDIRLAKSRVGDHAWGEAIRLDNVVNSRQVAGGTARKNVLREIRKAKRELGI